MTVVYYDTALECRVIDFLIQHANKLLPALPLPLHDFHDIVALYEIDIPLERLETTFTQISFSIPTGVILEHSHFISSGLSTCTLLMYDLEVLNQWMGYKTNMPELIDRCQQENVVTPAGSNSEKKLLDLIGDNSSFLEDRRKMLDCLLESPSSVQNLFLERALQTPAKPYTQTCNHRSRNECLIQGKLDCLHKVHFEPLITNSTDASIGDCSYLDTCYKGKGCKYVHYKIVYPDKTTKTPTPKISSSDNNDGNTPASSLSLSFFSLGERMTGNTYSELPAQWISCNIRKLDLNVLGKFAAIIADPPWDIHMNGHLQLPYGVITDEEILSFKIENIQTEGVFFLWVTGRALDIGRKCLKKWGYTHTEEIIWCKTNQLGRTICTGRTGHWLNHSKEHVLMGVKGNPKWLASKLDLDTIVSATRTKSHKPDELYEIAERLVGPASRKLELFGREHNTRNKWMTVGNQLDGTRIIEPDVAERFHQWRLQNVN